MTIYNWAEIPAEVKFMATDSYGWAFGWSGKPKKHGKYWNSGVHDLLTMPGAVLNPKENPFRGDWRESLEQRPEGV